MAKWWLVSWTTYGTWLPGDERGYCTWRKRTYVPPPKRYATLNEATYRADEHVVVRDAAAAICGDPVRFSAREKRIAFEAMISEIDQVEVAPAIISVGSWHVHWLCYFGTLKIRKVVGRVKAAATRALNAAQFEGKRPWTKGCNMRSKATRDACRSAYKYILRHRGQGCLIHEWPVPDEYPTFE
jgi:hypothetical protein